MSVTVNILFFASAREAIGKSSIELKLDAPATSSSLLSALALLYPGSNAIFKAAYLAVTSLSI